ncbi:MAG: NAD-dependent epimerase/dehydratase family protein [Candidatus Micrarchaeota archaeon]
MKIAVTGGAGFIGSHLVDELATANEVLVFDNLSSGKKEYINKNTKFVAKDIVHDYIASDLRDCKAVFHLAADPDVKSTATGAKKSFEQNVVATYNVLEACRKADVKSLVFTSTSTVYGEAEKFPTPEDHRCMPISNYGASKLAAEAYVSSYSATYGIKATILRYANIYGERSNHGVIYDFYHKLKKNPEELEILGDGKQQKSYLHVSDCIAATLTAWQKQKKQCEVFNVGSKEKHSVDEIAKLSAAAMDLKPKFRYSGGERGWAGDVRTMLLDSKKLQKLGWKQKVQLKDGIKCYIKWLSVV